MGIQPGQHLGPYRILEPLGKGGMATVYRASQPSLSRQVAIKVLPEFFAQDPAFHERFRQEAMSIARLRHPNILTVFDSGESDGVAYIVAELVEGGTLASRLGKPLPLEFCVSIARPIASALDYAHAHGMIHRDVKPSNILMAEDGTPILSDFGLARLTRTADDAVTRLTVTGTALGTPEYMAPEQIRGTNVGPAADIYALAAMLYEMLTGSVPHTGDTPIALLMSRLNDPLPMPRVRNPALSGAVEAVLVKGLSTEPSDRYTSAGEMVRALEAAGQMDERVAAMPETVATAVPAPRVSDSGAAVSTASATAPAAARKRPTGLIVASMGAVVIIVGIAIVQKWGSHAQDAGREAGTTPVPSPATETPQPPVPTVASTSASPAPATAPIAAAVPALPHRPSGDGLPPHGDLIYSLMKNAASVAAIPQPQGGNTIALKEGALEFTTGTDTGVFAPLGVRSIGDFMAVMRFVATDNRPSLTLRFHVTNHGEGHAIRFPAFLHLTPPPAGARGNGIQTCCQPFDLFLAPQTPDAKSIFAGPQPAAALAAPHEEQQVTVAVNGALIIVSSGGQEIARVTDGTFGAGSMSLGVGGPRGQSATLRLTALDIYDPPLSGAKAGTATKSELPPHGVLLYALANDLAAAARSRQQHAEDTVTVAGTALEVTAGTAMGAAVPLPLSGIGDFVAVLRIAAVAGQPAVLLRFHQPAQPGGYVAQFPAFLGLIPPVSGAPARGAHACCDDFDLYTVPLARGGGSLATGPAVRAVPVSPGEEQQIVVSVKGPVIVIYANGHEITRTTDSTFGPGRFTLQVQARRQVLPAIVRIGALEIYAAK